MRKRNDQTAAAEIRDDERLFAQNFEEIKQVPRITRLGKIRRQSLQFSLVF